MNLEDRVNSLERRWKWWRIIACSFALAAVSLVAITGQQPPPAKDLHVMGEVKIDRDLYYAQSQIGLNHSLVKSKLVHGDAVHAGRYMTIVTSDDLQNSNKQGLTQIFDLPIKGGMALITYTNRMNANLTTTDQVMISGRDPAHSFSNIEVVESVFSNTGPNEIRNVQYSVDSIPPANGEPFKVRLLADVKDGNGDRVAGNFSAIITGVFTKDVPLPRQGQGSR